jgi:prepilin-type processing-associated H-X9-DG protein
MKLLSSIANNVTGNEYDYPKMPKMLDIRHPSGQVAFFEEIFSITLEAPLGPGASGTSSRDCVYPCLRWDSFALRHNRSAEIAFLDGHAGMYKWLYVYNQNPPASVPRLENTNNYDIWWNPNRDLTSDPGNQ